jgi:hypothetical protein
LWYFITASTSKWSRVNSFLMFSVLVQHPFIFKWCHSLYKEYLCKSTQWRAEILCRIHVDSLLRRKSCSLHTMVQCFSMVPLFFDPSLHLIWPVSLTNYSPSSNRRDFERICVDW